MQVVVFASRKGGSGKTTLAGHLAVEADRRGAGPVALIDTDPQGSLAEWWNARAAATPAFVQTAIADLPRDVERLGAAGIRLVVVDTPPALTEEVAAALALADIVVIPTRPSPHDLRSIGATIAAVEKLGKPLVFALNGATPRARITGEAIAALSQHGPLVPTVIHHRVDFAASMIDGRTVMEVAGGSRSADEIARLWDYVADRLQGPRRPILLPHLTALAAATAVAEAAAAVADAAATALE